MIREPKFNNIKTYWKLEPPKSRASQIGMIKPRVSADKLTRAAYNGKDSWSIERLIHGAWEEVAECHKIADRLFSVDGKKYHSLQDVLEDVK